MARGHDRIAAQYTPRSLKISKEERQAAKVALKQFQDFIKALWAARQHDERLTNVLQKAPDTAPEQLFEVRHLLRKFQKEVRENYTRLIPQFREAIERLDPLITDTETGQIKENLVSSMQHLSEIIEGYMEAFDDFNSPSQVQRLITLSQKAGQLAKSIESIVEGQLQDHFRKNIFPQPDRRANRHLRMIRRARLIRMLGGHDGHY